MAPPDDAAPPSEAGPGSPPGRGVHAAFESSRVSPALHLASVGLAASALTAAIVCVEQADDRLATALAVACPAGLAALAWAACLRSPRTLPGTTLRWGWLASAPLAVLAAATTSGLLLGGGPLDLGGVFLSVPLAAICVAAFGLPIAWAQRLAREGLPGEDRGEQILGQASAAVGALGASLPLFSERVVRSFREGAWFVMGLGAAAVVTGLAGAMVAERRAARRKSFVREVEAGKVPGLRVARVDHGKVLVRVGALGGFRIAEREEDLVELDEDGEVRARAVR